MAQLAWLEDAQGPLVFASKPAEAPILHFAGPWQATFADSVKLCAEVGVEVYIGVGTPGRGPGSFVFVDYQDGIPPGVKPTVELSKPGSPPQTIVLEKRC